MKLLYFTDAHARGDSPRARRDNYQDALRRKFAEIRDLVIRHQCQAVLYGGDLTHTPDVALSVIGDLISELQQFPVPIYGVAGNTHDVWGDNVQTIRRTALGVIQSAGLIHLLEPGVALFLEEEGLRVQITGQHYHADIDRRDPIYDYCVVPDEPTGPTEHRPQHWRRPHVHRAIHIAHGMLWTKPFPGNVPVTLVNHLMGRTWADVTLSGHIHEGFGALRNQVGQWVVNPGALMRLSADPSEIRRQVQVALITLTPESTDVELIPLTSAAPGEEILDRSHIEQAEARAEALQSFLFGVRMGGNLEALDIPAIVARMADNKGVPDPVKTEALHRVQVAQEAIGAGAEEEVSS